MQDDCTVEDGGDRQRMLRLESLVQDIRADLVALNRRVEALLASGHNERMATAQNVALRLDRLESTLFKNDIRCRWQVVDALEPLLFPPGTLAKCPICGHEAPKERYETKVTECTFGGGRLERYVCPDCDCIFGPLKMMRLSATQLGEEYRQSYSVYSESNTTELERAAFEALKPRKDGIYLNYGAGAWNKTTRQLREEGYDVYDFEPYAPAESNPWVIRSFEQLSRQNFDGIFSNDVIEHFRNPIEDLTRLKALIKSGGEMVHCSGCYEYAFEYTRFHLAFFTGRSLSRLAAAAGLTSELGDRLYPNSPARLCRFRVQCEKASR